MSKKYILKPGKHQFAPGSPAIHHNDNLSDEEAGWYLEKYPHIAQLFTPQPPEGGALKNKEEKMTDKEHLTDIQKIEDQIDYLTPPLGGKEGL
jgi:hypothetical protein